MKQSLQLKISQSLTMTPQLQQAIKLLQLSSIDLQSEIQELLDSNPLLESDSPEQNEQNEQLTNTQESEQESPPEVQLSENSDTSEQIKSETMSEELATDTQWEDW